MFDHPPLKLCYPCSADARRKDRTKVERDKEGELTKSIHPITGYKPTIEGASQRDPLSSPAFDQRAHKRRGLHKTLRESQQDRHKTCSTRKTSTHRKRKSKRVFTHKQHQIKSAPHHSSGRCRRRTTELEDTSDQRKPGEENTQIGENSQH